LTAALAEGVARRLALAVTEIALWVVAEGENSGRGLKGILMPEACGGLENAHNQECNQGA